MSQRSRTDLCGGCRATGIPTATGFCGFSSGFSADLEPAGAGGCARVYYGRARAKTEIQAWVVTMSRDSGKYPVAYDVETRLAERNRLTSAFRIILAIPHLILVGGPGIGGSVGATAGEDSRLGGTSFGALGAVAWVMAVISWFAIVFTGRQPRGLWDFHVFLPLMARQGDRIHGPLA